jgi:hypothetical protein
LEKEYEAKIAEAGRQREALFQPMVERTRQVLTEEQRKRFDGMLRGGDRHRGPGSRPGTQSATRPFGGGMPSFDRGGRGGPGNPGGPGGHNDRGDRGGRPPGPPAGPPPQ